MVGRAQAYPILVFRGDSEEVDGDKLLLGDYGGESEVGVVHEPAELFSSGGPGHLLPLHLHDFGVPDIQFFRGA